MARFRKRRRRSSGRRSFGRRSRSSSGLSPMDVILGGALYGAARPYVANMLPPMFEFGAVDSDNALIGTAGFFGMKQKNKLLKAIGTITLGGEVAQVAAKMMAGTTSGSNGNNNIYV